ncbi:hypothetical protein BGAL_0455g00070 [Botrytis galanthina]|uniref:Uncharacterized protein n=1 Tax=Botrytis galanthina TaxID=278940 RepID=A0A4S8QNU3_9HELO|nr:hypothetical protein BGAL_0455g00070 [Botrytis galanthina]
MCQHPRFSFSSAYEDHLRSEHQISDEGSQLRAFVLQVNEPVNDVSSTACPLCDNWEESIGEATKGKKAYGAVGIALLAHKGGENVIR